MREDEKYATNSISKFIKSREPSLNISWRPGEDPPDAYLSIGDNELLLEITSTEVFREPFFGENKIRERTYLISHRDLVKEIEQEAIKQGKLCGKYFITFSKPLSSDKFSTYRLVFKSLLLELLNDSKTNAVGFDKELFFGDVEAA